MKVFLSSTSLSAAYGGPAVSVARLARALADAGVEVGLWSADQSRASPITHEGVRQIDGSAADALRRFGRPDILHDNGMWLPHHHRLSVLARRERIPRVVSTRGMLEPWARRHKWWKKALAWPLYQRADLERAALHHATSDAEAANLKELRLGVPVTVIPNGIDAPQDSLERLPPTGFRTALFIGRLYPIKGLPMLIEAWARLRPARWRLRIAGPDEAGHLAELRRLAVERGVQEVVAFPGTVEGKEKLRELRSADLFVLPSHSESFGIAIAEALAHGVPVLTTTAAPWPGLSTHQCGWRVVPSVDAIVDGLRTATALDHATLQTMGLRGRGWMESDFQWSDVARRFVACYAQLT